VSAAKIVLEAAPDETREPLAASKAFFDPTRPFPFTTVGDTRGRILDSARRCLLRLGSARVTMADVARAAAFSRPTVYKYFPDRTTLMKAVMAEGSAACDRDVTVAMDRVESLPEKLDAAVHVYWEWHAAARRIGFMTDEDFALIRGDVLNMEGALDGLEAMIESAVGAAQLRHEIRADVDAKEVARWLARIVMSFAQDRRLAAQRLEHGLVSMIDTFVMDGLRGNR
jgi:AcrR family transcriptional regulator